MFLIILIVISAVSFLIGLFLGKSMKPKMKAQKISYLEENELKNFLNYDGNIQ
ncbi:MAG: hypothetical protein IJO62_04355 [Clostridia bacterium]|nr:hypothetical protein [Clostridia bacterium]